MVLGVFFSINRINSLINLLIINDGGDFISPEEDDHLSRLLNIFKDAVVSQMSEGGDEEVEPFPYQILDFPDGKSRYVLEPVKKKMVWAKHNTEVVQISLPDKDRKVIVKSSNGDFLYVPLDYVRDIGFN